MPLHTNKAHHFAEQNVHMARLARFALSDDPCVLLMPRPYKNLPCSQAHARFRLACAYRGQEIIAISVKFLKFSTKNKKY
jgi:hypothetical protein